MSVCGLPRPHARVSRSRGPSARSTSSRLTVSGKAAPGAAASPPEVVTRAGSPGVVVVPTVAVVVVVALLSAVGPLESVVFVGGGARVS